MMRNKNGHITREIDDSKKYNWKRNIQNSTRSMHQMMSSVNACVEQLELAMKTPFVNGNGDF